MFVHTTLGTDWQCGQHASKYDAISCSWAEGFRMKLSPRVREGATMTVGATPVHATCLSRSAYTPWATICSRGAVELSWVNAWRHPSRAAELCPGTKL